MTPRADSVASEGSKGDGDAPSRPKRKAAENAPDYHAWNHGIAAPTTKWLTLIANPDEYGKDIHTGGSNVVAFRLTLS